MSDSRMSSNRGWKWAKPERWRTWVTIEVRSTLPKNKKGFPKLDAIAVLQGL